MFKAPIIIGIRQFRDWNEESSVDKTLYGLGENTGNMMFTQALLSVLDGARWGSFAVAPADLEDRDVIVLACANWINHFDDFSWLAERLERTKLPVVLVGIGAQSTLDMAIPEVTRGTRRFLDVVKDRSTCIAARGAFSCEVLESLGIRNAVATGCPSLLLAGKDGPAIEAPENLSLDECCLHATRHGVMQASELDRRLYRMAFRENLDIVLQSETPDICAALGKAPPEGKKDKFSAALTAAYGDDEGAISDYLRRRGHAFTNVASWTDYMKTRRFCFGTRIHGTVASLISGVAATLIAHDSRTLEMAMAMPIPFINGSEFMKRGDGEIIENIKSRLSPHSQKNYFDYYNTYARFFSDNNLCMQ